jgi:raffinose/stachyose/melibiose transport system permease protein
MAIDDHAPRSTPMDRPWSAATARPITTARTRHRIRPGRVALNLLVFLMACLSLFPVVWLLAGSLQTVQELYAGVTIVPAVPQFQNYAIAWNEGHFNVYVPNSLLYSVATVSGVLVTASMAAYALARIPFSGRGAVSLAILALLIIPLPASFIALYKQLVNMGLANTRVGYMLPLMAGGLPISIFILRGFFVRQPQDLEDAAVLDGCSRWDVFWRVMLPLAKPGLAAVAVIQFLHAWNEYLLALIIFSSNAMMPIQRGLTQFVSSETPQQQILLAATALSVLPVMILYAFAQRYITQGILDGAVKG